MDQYIGRLLDNRYEILEIIGTGGMAVVYKARCHRLNRLVAVKILKDEYSRDEEFRRRFHHEGEAVAMLSHPNIVQVYDVSSTDNADFIVMELIDGITLKQYMEKKGTLNWKETLHFSMQIGRALEHAHGRGIVHRDIKPHNVMVLKNGSVKVTDFGIARVMSKSNTLTKEALGSVHYISPEQAKGGWVDNRSDIYSLSVVMYEMMTGRPPYDGESPVAVAIQHINGGAVMPSTLNPNIPGGLEQIIMKGMALDTKDRYSSATEMLHDMDEFRKNPAILFHVAKPVTDGATRKLDTAAVAEITRQTKTTAEKVAGSAAGAAGAAAAAKARAAANQQRPKPATAAPVNRSHSNQANRGSNQSRSTHNSSRHTREEIRKEIRAEERNRMATIAVVACSAVAIIAIAVFLVLLVNGVLFNKSNTLVLVPDYVGDYYDQVEAPVGLSIEIGKYQHSDTYAKGMIIDQKPTAGSNVAQGNKIILTVSIGPEPAEKMMENLIGRDMTDAKDFLIAQGMNPLTYDEFNDNVPEGKVIRTQPAPGEPLTDGQTVYVYYSKGPVIRKEEMPKVTALSYDVAYRILKDQGFEEIVPEYKNSKEKEGTVIGQSVDRGVMVDVTTKIVLTVSKGPKETEPEEDYEDEEDPYEKPTQKPTEKPTEKPTQPPTDPPGEVEVTKTVTLTLPERDEDYILSIYQNGRTVMEDKRIKAGTTSINVVLTGTGTQFFEIYINDTYDRTEKVEFTSND